MSTHVVVPYDGPADLLIEGHDQPDSVCAFIQATGEAHEAQTIGGTLATPPVWSWRLYVRDDWDDNKWLELVGKDLLVRLPDGRAGRLKLVDSTDRFLTGYGRELPFVPPDVGAGR